ncbi:MAG: nuclear transport factor 2 family protein [Patescibacteria group bacterium]
MTDSTKNFEGLKEFPVELFYDCVDKNDFESFFKFIDENIKYQRQDYKTGTYIDIIGTQDFEDFYRNKRSLVGKHHIENIESSADGNTIVVRGMFKEIDKDVEIELSFVDTWIIKDRKVIERKSDIYKI